MYISSLRWYVADSSTPTRGHLAYSDTCSTTLRVGYWHPRVCVGPTPTQYQCTEAWKLRIFLVPSLHVYWWNFEGSLSRLWFLMHKFSKNERWSWNHWVWFLEWPQAPMLDLTSKSVCPQTQNSSGIGLKIVKSENCGRARLCGQISKGSFRSLNEPDLVIASSYTSTDVVRVPQYPGLTVIINF